MQLHCVSRWTVYILDSWVHLVQILCTYDIYSFPKLILFITSNKFHQFSFTLLASWIHRIFSKSSISPYIAASILDKKRYLYCHVQESLNRDNFFRCPVYKRLLFWQIFCIQLSKFDTLYISSPNFHLF